MPTSEDPTYDAPQRFRVPLADWVWFGKATRAERPTGRSPRGQVLREFMAWYMRRPGAKLPTRPPAGDWSEPGEAPPG
ncbi:hypothetical protein ACFWVB_02670 [Streptomyces microflavus]|uniref:hypothetical protein n=1 Tax=Streptomyces microflavus TaxID=1919 RepID=UPI00364EEDBA